MTAPTAVRRRTFAALSIPNYRRYLVAQLSTGMGFWMTRLSQDWIILEMTGGSGIAVGIATSLQFLPFILVTPWAGVLADRVSRRTLIVTAHVGLVLTALALLVALALGVATLPVIYAVALITGALAALEQPARQALVADLVGPESLVNAVGLNSVAFNLSRIAGPALAGLLLAGAGAPAVFGLIVALFATAGGTLASLRHLPPPPQSPGGRPTLRDALAVVRERRDLGVVLILVFVVATFGLNYQLTTGLMSTVEFGGGPAALGILSTFLALGALVGSLLAARRVVVRLRLVFIAALAFSAATIVAGLMPTWTTFAMALPVAGLCAMTFTTSAQSYLQVNAPPHMRGRLMGLYTLLFFAGTPLGAPLIGLLSDALGPRIGLVGGGAATLVGVAILMVTVRGMRAPSGARS